VDSVPLHPQKRKKKKEKKMAHFPNGVFSLYNFLAGLGPIKLHPLKMGNLRYYSISIPAAEIGTICYNATSCSVGF
jgi:hypothetical protein